MYVSSQKHHNDTVQTLYPLASKGGRCCHYLNGKCVSTLKQLEKWSTRQEGRTAHGVGCVMGLLTLILAMLTLGQTFVNNDRQVHYLRVFFFKSLLSSIRCTAILHLIIGCDHCLDVIIVSLMRMPPK